MGHWRRDGEDLLLEVRVQPRASRPGPAGVHGGRLRMRLSAPPLDGRANAELVERLADAFGVPRARVAIEHGETGRDKRIRIRGVSALPASLEGGPDA
ncbi:MAG: DUF167 family protein [Steroidobacteraceae bacterium]